MTDKKKTDSATRTLKIALDRADPLRALLDKQDTLSAMLGQSDTLAAIANIQEPHSAFAVAQASLGTTLADALEPIERHQLILSSSASELARVFSQSDQAMRVGLGPLHDLGISSAVSSARQLSEQQESMRRLAEKAVERFRFPELDETARILASMQSRHEETLRPLYSEVERITGGNGCNPATLDNARGRDRLSHRIR